MQRIAPREDKPAHYYATGEIADIFTAMHKVLMGDMKFHDALPILHLSDYCRQNVLGCIGSYSYQVQLEHSQIPDHAKILELVENLIADFIKMCTHMPEADYHKVDQSRIFDVQREVMRLSRCDRPRIFY